MPLKPRGALLPRKQLPPPGTPGKRLLLPPPGPGKLGEGTGEKRRKIAPRTLSWIAALASWALLSVLVVYIIANFRDRARLIRDRDNERIVNMVVTTLRDYDDFGSAIEANDILQERINGFAIYGEDLLPLYQWGDVPAVFVPPSTTEAGAWLAEPTLDSLQEAGPESGRSSVIRDYGRYTLDNPGNRSVIFVIHTGGSLEFLAPRETPDLDFAWAGGARPNREGGGGGGKVSRNLEWARQGVNNLIQQEATPRFVVSLITGEYYYVDIFHPAYWRTMLFTAIFLPILIVALLAMVLSIRNLQVRNREYRDRIEAQKNLVVLGTAASTLAHEIKNPLSSIRLQTGILKKLCPNEGDEIAIINEEVDRLSALTYRVNDYLREGKGNPALINLRALVAETGTRLCGREIFPVWDPEESTIMVLADPERMRSVFENLIRNALEAGGPPEEVSAWISRSGKTVTVSIRDRGHGITDEDKGRVFDPFFTKKSTGTGIGLSISRRFVEAAGGTISLSNRDGGGAEARVTLPEAR